MFQMPELAPEEAKRLLEEEKDNVLLLDVRTPPEHVQVRIPNSLLIPLDELRFAYASLPKDKKIIVYCRSGGRSTFATYLLRHLGYEAYNLAGGILTWSYERESGMPG
jgi:phage shock protein E